MSAPKPLSPEEYAEWKDALRDPGTRVVWPENAERRLWATIEARDKEIAKLKIDLALEKELVCRGSDEVVNRNQEIAKLKGARDRALALCDFYDLPGTRSELAAGLTDFKVDELVMVEFIDKLRAACE